jgi:hypothetical protein
MVEKHLGAVLDSVTPPLLTGTLESPKEQLFCLLENHSSWLSDVISVRVN